MEREAEPWCVGAAVAYELDIGKAVTGVYGSRHAAATVFTQKSPCTTTNRLASYCCHFRVDIVLVNVSVAVTLIQGEVQYV